MLNTLFDIKSNDDGTWRRIRVCEFMSKFMEKPNEDPEKFPKAKQSRKLPAPKRGYVHTINAAMIARGVHMLALDEKGKKLDPSAGVSELKKVGTQMKQGEPLMMIHYNDESRLESALEYLKTAYRLAPKRPNPAPLVVERVA